jgi:hypothetical protein
LRLHNPKYRMCQSVLASFSRQCKHIQHCNKQ